MTTVEIAAGALRGTEHDGVRTFLGVPYAEPPVGELRFRAPRPVPPWSGVREATDWAPRAPQPELTGRGFTGDEDCLYLNVYAPAAPGSYPVLVWIHGGGGVMGAPHQFDASAYARAGVVVVTVAYRLGVLGMLHLPGVADSNLSLRDQVAALEWVRDNVAAFGGDPGRVTLAGQSNGGRTVGTLLAVPATRGLVHQAIVQSGTGVGSVVHTPAEGAAIASAVLAELDAAPEDLADLPVTRILEAQQRVSAVSGTKVTYRVVVGDELLPERPLDAVREVPLLIGTTADEEDLFSWLQSGCAKLLGVGSTMLSPEEIEKAVAAYNDLFDWPEDQIRNRALTAGDWWIPAIRFAEKQPNAWMYRLDWRIAPRGRGLGAPHGLDLPLVFDDIRNRNWRFLFAGRTFPAERMQAMATEMFAAWVRFIATGDPGWPRYRPQDRVTRLFDDVSTTVSDPDRAQRLLWE
ncbi:carboxylesterase family protein [Amycolatopsis sp. SID8362]|uniref:carboxylesterase/lipase family protein n=1 Tax=Amycolatopsis sp. SID8362 TaxID=2690346 RepID=UPI00136B78A8|nr:carboxylesterase family protein [Amycolatopsis sp. SID8362]NBH07151.1 carboxylesterase family protein [Amycolatopsis sp. SID8362]NED43847.1 carboxylesterase/lipase family protein [Amycolatopsis sp. SID8362]